MGKSSWPGRIGRACVLLVALFSVAIELGAARGPVAAPVLPDAAAAIARPDARVQATPVAARAAAPTRSGAMSGYVRRVYTDPSGETLTYYLHVPHNYDPGQKYPLVLLLHGGGERARTENTPAQNEALLLDHTYARVWAAGDGSLSASGVQTRWPSFIVVPQLLYPNQWVNVPPKDGTYSQPAQPSASLRMAKAIVDDLQREYTGIDANRLYLTGLSQGGYGTWDALERWPHYFAAAAPICGAGDPTKASLLITIPIWAFHGAQDPIVPVAGSRDMIRALDAAGGHPRYTEYPEGVHNVWDLVYTPANASAPSADFLSWLFAQRRSLPATPASRAGIAR
ncbi:MAG: peptidase [Thermomicrobiales bacterium]